MITEQALQKATSELRLIIETLSIQENLNGKWIIGKKHSGYAVAIVWNMENPEGFLTMDIHKEIMEEAKRFNVKRRITIWGTVNAGPNGSRSYKFEQINPQDFGILV